MVVWAKIINFYFMWHPSWSYWSKPLIRLRVKSIMFILVETIKFDFDGYPSSSYWSKPSTFSPSEIHHGHICRNHQIRLRVKSIMVIWVWNNQIRLWVKTTMVIWVKIIKFVFEWNPSWSYGLKPSTFSSSETHHQIRLRVKSIMFIWVVTIKVVFE